MSSGVYSGAWYSAAFFFVFYASGEALTEYNYCYMLQCCVFDEMLSMFQLKFLGHHNCHT